MMSSPECVEYTPVGWSVDGLQPFVGVLRSFVVQLRGLAHTDAPEVLGDERADARERLESVQAYLLHHCSGSPLGKGNLSARSNFQASDQPSEERARLGRARSGLKAPRHFGSALGPCVDR
jgi:hypothetical protein